MRVEQIKNSNISFGILKSISKKPYGDYMLGEYKGYKIEIYDAKKYNQFLIYISDKVGNFVKSKLNYIENGIKKTTKAEGKKLNGMV